MEGNKELERAKEILCTYVVFYIIKIYDKMHVILYFTQGSLSVAYK